MAQANKRIYILVILVVLTAAIFIARLAQMQILWHDRLKKDYRTTTSGDRLLDTTRGSIYGANGEVLARDEPQYNLAVHYSKLEDPEWIPVVSQLTQTPASKLIKRRDDIIRRVQRIWTNVKKHTGLENLRILEQERYHAVVEDIPPEIAAAVRTEQITCHGLKVTISSKRSYPAQIEIPHIIGRTSSITPEQWNRLVEDGQTWTTDMPMSEIDRKYKMDDRIGVSGIEKTYESILRGRRGYVTHSLKFHPLNVERMAHITSPQPGRNVHLTLRLDFQEAATNALKWASDSPELDFNAGAIVILDVRSGALLAAATWPTYERATYRNEFNSILENEFHPLIFRPIQSALPTGSIYKIVTAIAGLEENIITADTSFLCQHRKNFNGRWFHCTGHHGHIKLIEAIEKSCNIYFYSIASRINGEKLKIWGNQFGLGIMTGIDLPFEKQGQVPEPLSLFGKINLSIGQGRLLCTPLQIAQLCAAIADNGRIKKPHIMSYITNEEGIKTHIFTPEVRQIDISPQNLELVRKGMYRVVHGSGGTARRANLERFQVAGKTGTAELGAGQPNHAWFAGFAPYDNPKIAFAAVNERTSGHGGTHAAPIIAKVLEQIWPEVEEMK
jgi:penicillin-binding protein 2